MPSRLNSETLTHWYFRLNGFLTIPNFIVHPDRGGGQRTDIDVLGVRFPYRSEQAAEPMVDNHFFNDGVGRPLIAYAEVKQCEAKVNKSWTDPSKTNMERFLYAVGPFQKNRVKKIAKAMYDKGGFEDDHYKVSWIMVGPAQDEEFQKKYPSALSISWSDVMSFIYRRFLKYRKQKLDHQQWDAAGKALWNLFEANREDIENFKVNVAIECGFSYEPIESRECSVPCAELPATPT